MPSGGEMRIDYDIEVVTHVDEHEGDAAQGIENGHDLAERGGGRQITVSYISVPYTYLALPVFTYQWW